MGNSNEFECSFEGFCKVYSKDGCYDADVIKSFEKQKFSRYVRFENFRNIGLEEPQEILLNARYEKGRAGDLIVLIGANNSGKSNVLDGICGIRKGFSTNDETSLVNYIGNNPLVPKLSLVYKDKLAGEIMLQRIGDKFTLFNSDRLNRTDLNEIDLDWERIAEDADDIRKKIEYHVGRYDYSRYYAIEKDIDALVQLLNGDAKPANDKTHEAYVKVFQRIHDISIQRGDGIFNMLKRDMDNIKEVFEYKSSGIRVELEGLSGFPKIHEYSIDEVDDECLSSSKDSLAEKTVFVSLFRYISTDISEDPVEMISVSYEQFKNNNKNKAILRACEKKINAMLGIVGKRFNGLYSEASDMGYEFEIELDGSGVVNLNIFRGDNSVVLANQSEGFKWFFAFFFNFILNNDLTAGDIVLMDEPAMNLHPSGQKELRKFIKEFATNNDITFVVATQSPFFIDVDNYDELRLVSVGDKGAVRIDNSFCAADSDEPDTISSIKRPLTIEQHVLYGIDTEVIWVEGITDYNYLTMFKRLFGDEKYNKLAFLPFNGVGKNDQKAMEILEKLKSIRFHKAGLLVDGDKAGKAMLKVAENSDFYSYCISKICDGKFKEIEDLFSAEDKKKYPFLKEKKTYLSSDLKNHSKLDDFSDETRDNFRSLFDYLSDGDCEEKKKT